jgi:hypothetical protein
MNMEVIIELEISVKMSNGNTGYYFGIERDSRKLIAWGGPRPGDEETSLGSLQRI